MKSFFGKWSRSIIEGGGLEGSGNNYLQDESSRLTQSALNLLPEICPQCNREVRKSEQDNYYDAECIADPLHYYEMKRKPEADRLWYDIPLPQELLAGVEV